MAVQSLLLHTTASPVCMWLGSVSVLNLTAITLVSACLVVRPFTPPNRMINTPLQEVKMNVHLNNIIMQENKIEYNSVSCQLSTSMYYQPVQILHINPIMIRHGKLLLLCLSSSCPKSLLNKSISHQQTVVAHNCVRNRLYSK